MAELFGFEIRRRKEEDAPASFAQPLEDDGAVVVSAGGVYGTYVDLENAARTESDLVTKYREMSMYPEVEAAIDDVVNEAIVSDVDEKAVTINLDDTRLSTRIKDVITETFDEVLTILDFKNQGYEIFKRWYVDGRLYYHAIIDEKDVRSGIQELRYIDPRRIRKIREVKKSRDTRTAATLSKTAAEYFIYNEKGINTPASQAGTTASQGVRIAKDAVVHCTSGLVDERSSMVLSHLHKAIKPLNQLRTLEDATVIYRISRAPERRIFYIDVGNLPKMKAEQYLRDMMIRHKNRVVYDASTGEVRDDRKFMTMLEDYWLPRREGGRGTEITTLPGGQNLGEMDDVLYFQKKLYKSLNVPESRLNPDTGFSLGRASEISRDEVKFSKFVSRLRLRFSHLFIKVLEKQLTLKGVMTVDEWKDLSTLVKFDFARDNFFSELKDGEILQQRMNLLQTVDNYSGKYYSSTWIKKNVLRLTDEEIEQMQEEMEADQEAAEQIAQDQQPPGDASSGISQGMENQVYPWIQQYISVNGSDEKQLISAVMDQFKMNYSSAYYYVNEYMKEEG